MKSLVSFVFSVLGFVGMAFSERSVQMKAQTFVMAVAVVMGVLGGVGSAQDQGVVLDVPYTHQVRDIGADGRNMCVPTSAVMCTLILHFSSNLRAYENYARINRRRAVSLDPANTGEMHDH